MVAPDAPASDRTAQSELHTKTQRQKSRTKKSGRELWKWRGCGKRGKPKAGFPLFPQPLGNLAKDRRDSHISTAPTGSRRMEKWKTKSRFPTFPLVVFALKPNQERKPSGGSLRSRLQAHPSIRICWTRNVIRITFLVLAAGWRRQAAAQPQRSPVRVFCRLPPGACVPVTPRPSVLHQYSTV